MYFLPFFLKSSINQHNFYQNMMGRHFLNSWHLQVSGNVKLLHTILEIIGEKVFQSQAIHEKVSPLTKIDPLKKKQISIFKRNFGKIKTWSSLYLKNKGLHVFIFSKFLLKIEICFFYGSCSKFIKGHIAHFLHSVYSKYL